MPLLFFVWVSQGSLNVWDLFFPIKFYHFRDRFLLKFILLHDIYVGYTKISFCDKLIFNHFCRTFVYFTIVDFTWYDFT